MRPDTRKKAVVALDEVRTDARIALQGTRAIWANIERFLPKHPKEEPADYERRSKCSEFFNAYGRTVRGMAGLPFAKPPVLSDETPKVLKQHWENIDGRGNSGIMWTRQAFEEALGIGGVIGVVDVQPTAAGVGKFVSAADEERDGVRPYWRRFTVESLMSWRTVIDRGQERPSQIVLRETYDDEDGEFGDIERVRYLVYRHPLGSINADTGVRRDDAAVTLQVYEQVTEKEQVVFLPGEVRRITNVSGIPVEVYLGGHPTSDMTALPTLLDLLDTNLGLLRVSNNRRWLMELCCVPIPVRKGGPPIKAVGSGDARKKPDETIAPNRMQIVGPDGDFYWAEPKGTAFGPSADEIKMLEARMAALGLAFLASDTRAAETARAKEIDATVQNSSLAAMCDTFDDWVERMMLRHAEFLRVQITDAGGGVSGGEFQTNRDYQMVTADPAKIEGYSKMAERGQLTLETLWRIMQDAGALPDDFDAKQERERLAFDIQPVREESPYRDDDEGDDDEETEAERVAREERERLPVAA